MTWRDGIAVALPLRELLPGWNFGFRLGWWADADGALEKEIIGDAVESGIAAEDDKHEGNILNLAGGFVAYQLDPFADAKRVGEKEENAGNNIAEEAPDGDKADSDQAEDTRDKDPDRLHIESPDADEDQGEAEKEGDFENLSDEKGTVAVEAFAAGAEPDSPHEEEMKDQGGYAGNAAAE